MLIWSKHKLMSSTRKYLVLSLYLLIRPRWHTLNVPCTFQIYSPFHFSNRHIPVNVILWKSMLCKYTFSSSAPPPASIEMQLVGTNSVNTSTLYRGRLEVREINGGTWGTVCDRGFDNREAGVVCEALGYDEGQVSDLFGYWKSTFRTTHLGSMGGGGG